MTINGGGTMTNREMTDHEALVWLMAELGIDDWPTIASGGQEGRPRARKLHSEPNIQELDNGSFRVRVTVGGARLGDTFGTIDEARARREIWKGLAKDIKKQRAKQAKRDRRQHVRAAERYIESPKV